MKTRFQISTNRPPPSIGKLFMLAAGLGCFRAEIVMDLRARTAGAGLAHLPEVILLVETENAVLRNARDLLPQFFGFVIFAENGDVQFVFRRP